MSVIIGRLRKDGVQASDVDLRGLWRRLGCHDSGGR